MPIESGPEKATLAQKLNLARNLVLAAATPFMLLAAREGTVGWRRLRGVTAGVGYLGFAALAAADLTGVLAWVFWAAVLQYVIHAAHARRAVGVHSWAAGEPRLGRLFGYDGGWAATCFLAVGGGVWLYGHSPAAGWWLGGSGVATLAVHGMIAQRQKAADQDLVDARIENAARVERLFEGRP